MHNDDENLFREAVKNVKPLKIKSKTIEVAASKPKPKPIAKKLIEDEKRVLLDSISDDYVYENIESEDGLLYLRHGHSPDILNKLKK